MDRAELHDCIKDIRVNINWRRAWAEDWPIEPRRISDVSHLYVPWRPTAANAVAEPATVEEVARHVELWPEQRPRIEELEREMGSVAQDRLVFPAYHFSEDQALLLDGNHRAVALTRTKTPFTATLLLIKGPLDETGLPEIRRWLPANIG